VLRGSGEFPRGNPENPVSTAGLEEKFAALVEPRFGAGAMRHALNQVRSIEQIEDMRDAFSAIVPA
jgi:hypothetical protein